MNDEIGVILVNYNGKEYNHKCIMSILNSTIGSKLHIIVVDNASTDNSVEELKEEFAACDRVQIIELDDNYGFSKANNAGISWALQHGIEFFLLLNNDTEIDPYALERMMEMYKEKKGIIVPKIFFAGDRTLIWCAGGEFSTVIKKPKQRGFNQLDNGETKRDERCAFANGCAILLSKEVVDKIGLLDERFFLYYEDTEYSMRAEANDVNIYYCDEAIVYHKVNGSTKGNENAANVYYITRNWLLCNSIHFETWRFVLFCVYFTINRSAWMLIWLMKGMRENNRAMFYGIRDFIKERWGRWNS